MTDWHLATAYERIADTIGDSAALICDKTTLSWSQYDSRAAKIAAVLSSYGLGPDSKAGIYLHNSNEYLEAHHGICKLRGCPINVNYRYKEDELLYLLDNSDAQALIYQACYADRIAAIQDRLSNIRCYLQVDDGSGTALLAGSIDYEAAIASADEMPRINRSADDVYMFYTGGTTGMPKGVMYANGSHCQGLAAAGAMLGLAVPETIEDIAKTVKANQDMAPLPIGLVCCPLMHATGMWIGAMIPQLAGGAALTVNHLGLDPDLLWAQAQKHQASLVTIVGDAFARPLLEALDQAAAKHKPYDLSRVTAMISSGVMWSQEIKTGLLKHNEMMLIDAMGSTEGSMGTSVSTRDAAASTAKFQLNENVKVFNDDDQEVRPGSGEMGMVATQSAMIGYYKDPDKTAKTIRVIDGERYTFPGDFATVEADGSTTLLGRGSMCINTAGEKVFPEEVEEVIKQHEMVVDCLVVGVADQRFGQKVVALVSVHADTLDEDQLKIHCRELLAGYKLAKNILFVDVVQRAQNGKADYKWAKQTALERLGVTE